MGSPEFPASDDGREFDSPLSEEQQRQLNDIEWEIEAEPRPVVAPMLTQEEIDEMRQKYLDGEYD